MHLHGVPTEHINMTDNDAFVQFPVENNAEIGLFVCTLRGGRGPGEHLLPPSPVGSLHQSQRSRLQSTVTDL